MAAFTLTNLNARGAGALSASSRLQTTARAPRGGTRMHAQPERKASASQSSKLRKFSDGPFSSRLFRPPLVLR